MGSHSPGWGSWTVCGLAGDIRAPWSTPPPKKYGAGNQKAIKQRGKGGRGDHSSGDRHVVRITCQGETKDFLGGKGEGYN